MFVRIGSAIVSLKAQCVEFLQDVCMLVSCREGAGRYVLPTVIMRVSGGTDVVHNFMNTGLYCCRGRCCGCSDRLPVIWLTVFYPHEGHETRPLLRGEWDISRGEWFWCVNGLLRCKRRCIHAGDCCTFIIHKMKLLWTMEDGFTHIRWASIDGTKYRLVDTLAPARKGTVSDRRGLVPLGHSDA